MKKVKFSYKNKDHLNIKHIYVFGNFQFYKSSEVGSYKAFEDNEQIKTYAVDEYQEGMFYAGSTVSNTFLEYEMKETKKDVYEIELTLPKGTYNYNFKIIDDLGNETVIKDPDNLPLENPDNQHSCNHSLIVIGKQLENTGTLSFVTYTAVDKTKQPLGIWTPKGYTKDKKYKTIYISHGGGGNEADWMSVGFVPEIMSQYQDDFIVVSMDHTYFKWDEELVSKNMVECIIPYIEKNYSVIHERKGRAMCGLSMGSMMTNMLAKKHPEVFGYFGAFSGGTNDLNKEHYKPEIINQAKYYLSVGSIDIAYNNDRGISTLDYLKLLDELKIQYDYELLDGTHDWEVWRTSLKHFIENYLL